MKNILIIDKESFSTGEIERIENALSEQGFTNYETVLLPCGLDDVKVRTFIKEDKHVGGFVILTPNREKFSANFPNNTIQYDPSTDDVVSICKHIVYILTNFGREYKDTSRIFVTSDTHFCHGNIIRYCNRPWADVDAMTDGLVERWNSVVGKDDIVIHLGDFCFGGRTKVENVFKRLNGKIDLVLGNHDKLKISDYYSIGFHRVYDRPVIFDNFFVMSHAPLQWIKDGDVYANIFGHVHDMPLYKTWTKNTCCACVERHNYTPILLDNIKATLEAMNQES